MNCSVCNKQINKSDILYRCCDQFVCSYICSQKRVRDIKYNDPYLDNPTFWDAPIRHSDNSVNIGMNLAKIDIEKPIKTKIIYIEPNTELQNVTNKKEDLDYDDKTKSYFFLNCSMLLILGLYLKSKIKNLY